MTVCARPNATSLRLASSAKSGGITVLALVQPSFAKPSCCRLWHRPRKHRKRRLRRIPSHKADAGPVVMAAAPHSMITARRSLRCLPQLAWRAKPLEHAWIRVAREAVWPESQVVLFSFVFRTHFFYVRPHRGHRARAESPNKVQATDYGMRLAMGGCSEDVSGNCAVANAQHGNWSALDVARSAHGESLVFELCGKFALEFASRWRLIQT